MPSSELQRSPAVTKLVSSPKLRRDKSLRILLKSWQSKNLLPQNDAKKLWKSLFYSVYHSDKPHLTLQSYVVYLGAHSHGTNPSSVDLDYATKSHHSLLSSILGSYEKAKDAIFYSYNRHINGFAAILEDEEAEELARHPNVVSVSLNKMHELHTTRSWEFLGLEGNGIVPKDSIWEKARYGEDIIIGNLDTGVWPESQSFSDQGMGPIPSKWRGNGICQIDNFIDSNKTYCNRKLIGARVFYKGYEAYAGKLDASFYTARDAIGHGSHTLSTAGGNFVQGVSVFGNGNGTAKGGSPKARVAAYKVCWLEHSIRYPVCYDADILAGFEAAISDGVDVLSVSLGGSSINLFSDSTAIGSLHAVANGIVVVSSAGNSGPYFGTVLNVSPWLFTVAASTIDRDFTSYVKLGDNKNIKGTSLSSKHLPSRKFYPLISGKDAKHYYALSRDAKFCRRGTLDVKKVKGKIVLCHEDGSLETLPGPVASSAGAVGMILANGVENFYDFIAYPHVLPTSHVNYSDGQYIYSYIQSEENPVAYISKVITEVPIIPAPVIASFSSRGPSTILPSILKPDVTAPGVNIIAAYSESGNENEITASNRRTPYKSMSGTSMACPHVSGLVGLLKTIHPGWSPAAIKSAIMTTASGVDNSKRPIKDRFDGNATPFAYGAGHIQPDLAIDPGLIYDLDVVDYLNLLWAYNQSHKQIKAMYNRPFIFPKSYNVFDFNYPTITILDLGAKIVNVSRTVTNVGPPSIYNVQTKAPDGISILVEPSYLSFKEVGEKKSFKVIVMKTMDNVATTLDYVFGELLWTNGKHRVRSTIAVKFK